MWLETLTALIRNVREELMGYGDEKEFKWTPKGMITQNKEYVALMNRMLDLEDTVKQLSTRVKELSEDVRDDKEPVKVVPAATMQQKKIEEFSLI